jgi:uncharacterized integral membrane protein (TIGR00698 family)
MKWIYEFGPGILMSLVIALAAFWFGQQFPLIGGPVFAIVIGIVINNTVGKPKRTVKGAAFTSKKVLQWAVILLGGGLNLTQVYKTGSESMLIILSVIAAAFITAYGAGRLMKIPSRMKALIGVGTAICGGSAIVAVAPIIEAEELEVAYSISTIFLFNIIAVLVFPALGHLLGFSDRTFGLWAGTSINDTSSVVAAAFAFSSAAGAQATIVKLTRATMILPAALIFGLLTAYNKKKQFNEAGSSKFSLAKILPWFIISFLIASLLNTMGLFSPQMLKTISSLSRFMITMALAAIGLGADFSKMIKSGLKPVFLGLITWLSVTAVSLGILYLTGQIA